MATQSSKWSLIGFGFILIAIGSWKHFYDLVQWSQDLSSNYFTRPRHGYQEIVHVAQIEPNCGIRHSCSENSFPIFLSTGTSTDGKPKLCVSSKYVIKPIVKEEGRGLNAAIIEPNHFEVVSVRNFDTYLYNKSGEISEWLEGLLDNDILIIFTSDEASSKLSVETKALLNQLGSGKIQNLQYRSQWFMITQKGTQGFTTYEKITYSKKKSWGEAIEFRGCIPRKILKKLTTADEPLRENKRKVQFCEGKKDEKYKGFCNEPRFEIIMPALLTNKSLVGNLVYSLPIFLFAGENLEVLIATLDNMIHEPGVIPSQITVLYENNTADVPSLAKIYGMHSNKTKIPASFEEKLVQARDISRNVFPKKKYLIVMDSDVIPSPDFLFFFAQTLPVLEKDTTLSTISAWSSNCYDHDGNVHTAYRVQGVPKYAALISARSESEKFFGDMIAPDTARVQGLEACHLPSLEPNNWIERPQDLIKDRYFHKIVILQQLSKVVDAFKVVNSCSSSVIKNDTNVIYVKDKNKIIPKLLSCLGVLENQYGQYDGIIRLVVNDKSILIITSELELPNNELKTSTQIGLAYTPAQEDHYEKLPLDKLPKVRLGQNYKVGTGYTKNEGYKTTYHDTYKTPVSDEPQVNSKLRPALREYSKVGKEIRPISFGETEYKSEFDEKPLPPCTKGVNVDELASCPMVTIGRDERDPLPMTQNYFKYLDIYLTTNRLAHRQFTRHEQRTIASKDIVTTQETMEIPKGRGYGCRFPAFAGQDLDNRDRNMYDKALFNTVPKAKFIPKRMPKVPHFGSESEMQASYKEPQGYAMGHLFDRFIEFPKAIEKPTAKQALCPPGMYKTEKSAIDRHTSPQIVV